MAFAKGIVELRNHLTRNVFALDKRFKEDFDSEFIQEVKDTLDINWMIESREQIEDEVITRNEANDIVEDKGKSALKFLMLRQSIQNPPSHEQISKVIDQYQSFKNMLLILLWMKTWIKPNAQ